MKIIFFGSSDFSLFALKACLHLPFEVVFVVTTPAQRKGRGLIETPTPVQDFAASANIPFAAPFSLKTPELMDEVKKLNPDLMVVSSYGKLIPSAWLQVPSRYCLNVHPSLLPKYRGAAPIHWPIVLGDKETGVSIAEVTSALDAGDIFFQTRIPIPETVDALQMTQTLGENSAFALREVLKKVLSGPLARVTQAHDQFNYARKLCKEDGRLDWNRSAIQLHNQIRGFFPWPSVSIQYQSDSLQIVKSHTLELSQKLAHPGMVTQVARDSIQVQAGEGILSLDRLKPAGKKEMSAGDYARGKRIGVGDKFNLESNPPNLVLTQSIR